VSRPPYVELAVNALKIAAPAAASALLRIHDQAHNIRPQFVSAQTFSLLHPPEFAVEFLCHLLYQLLPLCHISC
jgi:hypothetical protein